MALVQATGVVAIAVAILLPLTVFRTALDPTADVSVVNQTNAVTRITIAGETVNLDWYCTDYEVVSPNSDAEMRLNVGGDDWGCWGSNPRSLEVRNSLGVWTCDWSEARRHQPIEITEDGPACNVTSYVPPLPTAAPAPPNSPPIAETPVPSP
jgi:hypothetical protein